MAAKPADEGILVVQTIPLMQSIIVCTNSSLACFTETRGSFTLSLFRAEMMALHSVAPIQSCATNPHHCSTSHKASFHCHVESTARYIVRGWIVVA